MTKVCLTLENEDKVYIDLYEEYAPLTVANFLHLVDIDFYAGTVFHRIIQNFMCQGGGYVVAEQSVVTKDAGYTIPGEFAGNNWVNKIRHKAGTISMARTSDMNSANSQFFICDADCAFLDDQYAAFGTVADEDSLEIIKKLAAIPTVDIGGGMANFPNDELKNFTIKLIQRI